MRWHAIKSAATGERPRRLVRNAAVVGLALCGALLIVGGLRSAPPRPAPLPPHEFSAAAVVALQGTSRSAGCHVHVAASRVVVPSLCMAGRVVPVGTGAGGAVEIPPDVRAVGLWVGGAPMLAARGTTLLVGHVNYSGQGNGALYNLYRVRPRALVYLADAARRVTRWRITALRVVPKQRLPQWVFAGRRGPRRLVLVTCGGPIRYVPGAGYHYRDNVIAVATPA